MFYKNHKNRRTNTTGNSNNPGGDSDNPREIKEIREMLENAGIFTDQIYSLCRHYDFISPSIALIVIRLNTANLLNDDILKLFMQHVILARPLLTLIEDCIDAEGRVTTDPVTLTPLVPRPLDRDMFERFIYAGENNMLMPAAAGPGMM